MKRSFFWLVVAGALALSGGGALAQSNRTLSVVAVGGLANINTLPINVAMDRGYFKDEHLDVEIVNQASITTACSAILSGSVDMGQCTANEMVPIDRKGGHLVQFHGMWQLPNPYFVVTPSAITSWEQLKGKTVMLSQPKDVTVYMFERMAKAHGYKLEDFTYVYAGSSAARLAALQAGSVQAALLANPTAPLVESTNGAHLLDSSLRHFSGREFGGGGWVATEPWLAAHRDAAVGWIRANNKAVAWLYDPANRAQVLSLIGTTYKLSNPSVVQKIFDSVIPTKYYSPTGCTNERAEQGIFKMLIEMQLLPAGSYNSAEFAPNLYAEGAIGRRCR